MYFVDIRWWHLHEGSIYFFDGVFIGHSSLNKQSRAKRIFLAWLEWHLFTVITQSVSSLSTPSLHIPGSTSPKLLHPSPCAGEPFTSGVPEKVTIIDLSTSTCTVIPLLLWRWRFVGWPADATFGDHQRLIYFYSFHIFKVISVLFFP